MARDQNMTTWVRAPCFRLSAELFRFPQAMELAE